MAIAVTVPTSPHKVGPGYRVTATGFSGPTALDDIFQVSVADHTTGCGICIGTALFAGFTSASVILGDTRGTNPFATRMLCDQNPGDAVDLVAQRFTHGGSFIEGTTATGFSWDPLNGLWVLSGLLLWDLTSGNMAEVLNAVRKTYVSP